MLDKPAIVQSEEQLTAVIRLTVPREEIQNVMGPAMAEVVAAVAAQGIQASGPLFSYHFRMDPAVFDFKVGLPVAASVSAVGRVQTSRLPATTVARSIYRGGYEGLAEAWGQFEALDRRRGTHTSLATLGVLRYRPRVEPRPGEGATGTCTKCAHSGVNGPTGGLSGWFRLAPSE